MCLGEKLKRGERESARETAQKLLMFLQNEGSRSFFSGKLTLQLPAHLVWLPATTATQGPPATPVDISNFDIFWPLFKRIFEGLPRLRLS